MGEILEAIKSIGADMEGLDYSPEVLQYYIPMGFQCVCEMTLGLPSAVYIAELRSSKDVHPTLRPIAQKLGEELLKIFPQMYLYCDFEPDKWSTSRGTQTIIKK